VVEISFPSGTMESAQSKEKIILDELNKCGQEGWKVTGFDLFPRLITNEPAIKILLEKESDN
jgi:hypothetical protein